jgi:hypothetical protein
MRNMLRGAVGLTAGFLILTAAPVEAQTRESSLLGIKLWRTWRDVLTKHGQPTRIEVGAVTAPVPGQNAGQAAGMMGGGMPGPMAGAAMGMSPGGPMPGMGSMGMMGGPGMSGQAMAMSRMMSQRGGMGSPGGGMASGPPPGVGGSMGGGSSKMGAMMGSMGSPGGGPQLPGMEGAGGDLGLRGFGSPGGGPGPGAMMGSMGAMGGQQAQASAEGEVTWVYEKPAGLTYMFLFNKDGRVIQISQFGYRGGARTSRGVALGSAVRDVYAKYGWANSSAKAGNQLTLDYSHKANVAFQLLNRGKGAQVVGVTVAITERDRIPGVG